MTISVEAVRQFRDDGRRPSILAEIKGGGDCINLCQFVSQLVILAEWNPFTSSSSVGKASTIHPSTTTTPLFLVLSCISTLFLFGRHRVSTIMKPWHCWGRLFFHGGLEDIEWNVKMYIQDMIETRFIDNRP